MGISLPVFAASLSLAVPAEIAFTSDAGLFSVKADGSGQTLLAPAPKGKYLDEAAWSPDGTRLVYSQGDDDTAQLMLKDATGTRTLTPERAGTSEGWPAWSPDGSTIAFLRFTLGEESILTQLIARDVATGAERVLVAQPWDDHGSTVNTPAYSPDGTTIAYTYSRYDRNADSLPEIRTIPAQGGPAKTLIKRAQAPSYSPDGTRIAYASIADHNGKQCGSDTCSWAGELYVANADGSQPRRLTKDEGDLSIPRWSPDGSRILFSSDRNLPDANSDELYTIGADGSCLTWLTNSLAGAGSPAWRPGSGDSFTANCDPTARKVAYTAPSTKRYRGNLWLGAKRDGLLLSSVTRSVLWYGDCERFTPCRDEVILTVGNPCKRTYSRQYTLSVRKGLLVAIYAFENQPVVFGGARETLVPRHVLDDVRVLRREKPRIPRSFLAPLSAAQKAKLKPYRSC